jgi:predicted NAD/FAD-binding protein
VTQQRIAIIGAGIAGLTTASKLHPLHDIKLFEYNDYIGGHTHTQLVTIGDQTFPVNTGFIVYNDWVYHNFNKLMAPLNVERIPTEMSFSVSDEVSGLEYNGHNLDTLFAQRKNLLSPSFYGMIKDILRFNKESQEDLDSGNLTEEITLNQYFKERGYCKSFIDKYIIPMGAAIWSSGEADMLDFPALFFVRFFKNHGLLSIKERPQWYVLKGGSQAYVKPLIEPFKNKIQLNARIKAVNRSSEGIVIVHESGEEEPFDQVVFACHSNQALSLLGDPSKAETEVLTDLPYADNEVVLHTDERLLPKRKKAWAAWNYHLSSDKSKPASLTYNMNILQRFDDAPATFCVTLNRTEKIDPSKIIKTFNYAHPVFNRGSIAAQQRHSDISGVNNTHYCGAYWFNGFHEDGVNSALRVVDSINSTTLSKTDTSKTNIETA